MTGAVDLGRLVSDDAGEADGWAETLVQLSAYAHAVDEPRCRGYTMASSGRAWCGACGWEMSARMQDVGTAGSARFALAALAQVGWALQMAREAVINALLVAVLA